MHLKRANLALPSNSLLLNPLKKAIFTSKNINFIKTNLLKKIEEKEK